MLQHCQGLRVAWLPPPANDHLALLRQSGAYFVFPIQYSFVLICLFSLRPCIVEGVSEVVMAERGELFVVGCRVLSDRG